MSKRQEWEYSTTVFGNNDRKLDIDGVLHEAGPKGWELIGIANMREQVIFIFKRPSGWG